MSIRNRFGRIGIIFGITAVLMLFVIPIILSIYFSEISNNKTFSTIYFIIFLTFTAIGNITLEKSNSPMTRDEKIDQVLIESTL